MNDRELLEADCRQQSVFMKSSGHRFMAYAGRRSCKSEPMRAERLRCRPDIILIEQSRLPRLPKGKGND